MKAKAPKLAYPDPIDFGIDEMMFYQYLPIKDAGNYAMVSEPRIERIALQIGSILAGRVGRDEYVYLTVKHGWATTENPLNRPGWHVDAWGHPEDRNYVWCDRFPTRYIWGDLPEVQPDMPDEEALVWFEKYGKFATTSEVPDGLAQRERPLPDYVMVGYLYEFGQNVVHATPVIPYPGMRSFVKVSVSPHKYNLLGNSRNEINADWEMIDRSKVRNDPVAGNKDYA